MIDWVTVIAQIVNFLILVFLLKKFLYRPIIEAMDRREQKITSGLEEAETKKREAEQEKDDYTRRVQAFEAERASLIAQAKLEAEQEKKELLRVVHNEVDGTRKLWNESIMQQKEAFLMNLRKRTGEEIYAIASHALSDLAAADLERRIADIFIKKLNGLNKTEQSGIQQMLQKKDAAPAVASSFALDKPLQASIVTAVNNLAGYETGVTFEVSEDIICGIVLRVEGYMLGWNIHEYLISLENEFNRILEAAK